MSNQKPTEVSLENMDLISWCWMNSSINWQQNDIHFIYIHLGGLGVKFIPSLGGPFTIARCNALAWMNAVWTSTWLGRGFVWTILVHSQQRLSIEYYIANYDIYRESCCVIYMKSLSLILSPNHLYEIDVSTSGTLWKTSIAAISRRPRTPIRMVFFGSLQTGKIPTLSSRLDIC